MDKDKNKNSRPSVLMYLKENLGKNGDFMAEWKKLSREEQGQLRDQAKQELGI